MFTRLILGRGGKRGSSFGGKANRSGIGVFRLGPDVAQPAIPPSIAAAFRMRTHRAIMAIPRPVLGAAEE